MIKRSVVIQNRCYVSVLNNQLTIENRETGEMNSVPIEDVGYLEFESAQCTVTTAALSRLAAGGAVVVVCNQRYAPEAITLPLEGNTLHAERIQMQVSASTPVKKRLWQQLVRCKIRNQAAVLKTMGLPHATVARCATMVYTADRTNREAVAAKAYWQQLLKLYGVTRDPDGLYPNNFLNYGYAVLRSSVARGLVRAGLHPALGIHHSNRSNAFALADDVMEPYRPFADLHILQFCATLVEPTELQPPHKKEILQLLVRDVQHSIGRRPLLNSVEVVCAQVAQTLGGSSTEPDLPILRA
ncbi:MAG: type II CRISPR-associated endonuclease Cas1 [Chlorobi bacterium]|nr:MAG: type II CRISPR-associated endonuclease Cas1 [Bacteroidota bacterium]KXK36107.1 MAG: DNA repair protein [Chlorobi bacterium OLB6]MBE2266380.1 type II CRISPR-associated endonuclease Cas1 [Flavobacteriales bacterium]MBL1160370.1 type II CRISPR-associated endonuclease Cas1 [Chlorobiota bacterium]MBW7854415.1 type II CRISPR-associated endonuclease Cas1 [Candidatus Kapabacteria bacterium]MCC6331757.1 type II CRISPR-associated endonuclease Cas1 [Ignavibacteria bacterium]